MFDLQSLVETFVKNRSLSATDGKRINDQGLKYFQCIGHKDVQFMDCDQFHLIDQNGVRYLDMMASFAAAHFGRNHPVIRQAVHQAIDCPYPNLIQVGIPVLSTIFAQKLTEWTDGDFDRVFFTNGGAEATDAAIKMALHYTGRKRMVYFTGDYHGLTIGAISVNGVTSQQKIFNVQDVHTQIGFNDCEALTRTFAKHGRDIAGIIIEPVQARTGQVVSREFAQTARALCDKHDCLLVYDEIKSSFGRTGRKFFYNWYQIKPDVVEVAKGISGGTCGIGAVLLTEKVHKKIYPTVDNLAVYSSTFKENNIAMAVGLAVLHLFEVENPCENVLATEKLIVEALHNRQLRSGARMEVTGKGLQLNVRVARENTKLVHKLIDGIEKDLFYQIAVGQLFTEKKIVSLVPNRFGGAVAVTPALNIPLDLVRQFCTDITDVFEDLTTQSNWDLLKTSIKEVRGIYA